MEADLDDKKWDRPWTTDEIRKNSANWTLAGDVGLYNLLNEFSQNIISRTHEVENAVDSLVYKTKMANAKINNVINDFHMLSNLQFVENRVYDEEITESVPETKPAEKTKEQKEAEMLPKIIKAVELGLQVLDQAFNKINVNEISDSEDEDLSSEGRTILEPKDPYEHRPLPFIIGSEEFQNSDYAGLQDLLEEDADYSAEIEVSPSDSEETSTDEEEPLPLDEEPFMKGPTQDKLRKRSISNEFSSSEESELFGSEKGDNGFISDSSLDSKLKGDRASQKTNEESKPEVKPRQSSVSTLQSKLNLAQVLPTPKPIEKKEKDDLFMDDEASDEESPFRKKTGLFQSDLRFDEEKDMFDNDLFGDLPKESKVAEKPKPKPIPEKTQTSTVQKKKEEATLFGNDDDDSEDDIFKTLVTRKTTNAKDTSINRQESLDKADSSSTPSSTPSSKPAGNAFGFLSAGGNSDSLFGDESDADDLFSSKKPQKTFGFDASQEDDLFGLMGSKTSNKTERPNEDKSKKLESEKQSSLFKADDVVDKPHKRIGQPLPGLVPAEAQEPTKKETPKSFMKIGQPLPGLVKKKTKDSIFEDSDSSGQEDIKNIPKVSSTKRDSLFGDDDDDDDDIFSQAPKKLLSPGKSPSLVNKPKQPLENETKSQSSKKAEKQPSAPSLFDNDDDFGLVSGMSATQPASSTDIVKKPPSPSLFDNDDDDDFGLVTKRKTSLITNKDKSKDLSLFEDSDNFDLFSPKPATKPTKTSSSLLNDSSEEDSLFKISVKKDISQPPKKQLNDSSEEDSLFKTSIKTDKVVPPKTQSKDTLKEDTVSKPDKIDSPPTKKTETIKVEDDGSKSSLFDQTDGNSLKKTELPSPVKQTSLEDAAVGFDTPVDTSNTLHALNKSRAKISGRRRPPTKKGRAAASQESSSEKEYLSSDADIPKPSIPTDDLFSAIPKEPTPVLEAKPSTHKVQEKKKMDLMSQLMSEAASSKVGKRASPAFVEDDEDDVDIFSEVLNKDRTKSRGFSFHDPVESKMLTGEKKETVSVLDSKDDDDNEDFFAEPSFKRTGAQSVDTLDFRNSISHKDPILDLDDDDDDLFSTIKSAPLKPKTNASDADIFADDDTDIFAGLQKEKYEMFPSQLYDNEDDDIFGGLDQPSTASATNASSKTVSSASVKKEAEKKPVNAFEDPLSGLLGDD